MVIESKRIKIFRIIARLNVGGPARHAAILAGGLNNERYSSTLIYGALDRGEGDMSYLIKENGAKAVYLPELGRSINPVGDIRSLIKVYSIIRKERPHIVHTHTAKGGIIGRLAAMFAGVPVKVHTFHGHIFHGYFSKWAACCFLWMERALAHFTDCIIALSPKQKGELLGKYRIGAEEKYRIINLGLDLEPFSDLHRKRGQFRERYHIRTDDILVGIIGRLVPVKNHRMFMRVARDLKSRAPEELFKKIKFVIVGDGPEREMLEEYAASLGIQDRVIFTGWVKEIAEVYADIDIVALTSRNEGTPVSLIEAFASSKPVVATDVGGVHDIVQDAHALVDKDDEASFAQRLLEFIQSSAMRQKAGEKGREYVVKNFLKEGLIAQIEKLYLELISEKGVKI